MRYYFYWFILFSRLSLSISTAYADTDLTIVPYQKKYSWKEEWTLAILDELSQPQYQEDENSMLNQEIDEDNLAELGCIGYNEATVDEKSDFWVVFFSALTRAESAFNEKAKSRLSRGHRSYGLLQLAKSTAKAQCSLSPHSEKNSPLPVNDPELNLRCGVKLMSWQLLGAPTSSGKQLRPDLEGKIFGKRIFQWGPLRQNDLRGRKILVQWFKKHLDQLPFCEAPDELQSAQAQSK